MEAKTCQWPSGCNKPTRARKLCDTHYRTLMRRERGVGGIEPKDDYVYKVRVKTPYGSQPHYYSQIEKAMERVAQARKDGTLLYFAEYRFNKRIGTG